MNGYLLLIFTIFLCSHVHAEDSETLPLQSGTSQSSTSQDNKPDTIRVEATASELEQLIDLVNNNDFSSAYQLGQSMIQEWEGDEQYDFHFALSAAQEGHYTQAIFSFERLLSNHPNNDRFRVELARCHFFLKNYRAAEYEFNKVKSHQPPEAVINNINGFLAKIAEQKQQIEQSWNSGGSLSFGHDSNINAATDLDNVDATLFISNSVLKGRLNLDEEQKSQESTYYQVQGFSQFQKPISKRSNLDASIFISNKDNAKNDTYDLTHASIDGGFRILRSNHNFRIGAAYRHYWLEYKTLQDQLLANFHWQWHFSPGWNFTEALEMGKQNNDQNNSLDYHQWQSKSSLQRNISDFNQTLSFSLGSDASIRSSNQFQARDYFSLIYQLQKGLTEKQRLFALINYRKNDYQDKFDNQHIFYANKTRSDQLKQLIAGWSYSFTKNISSKLQVSHSQNDSNLDLYEYQRTLVEAGLMISFN